MIPEFKFNAERIAKSIDVSTTENISELMNLRTKIDERLEILRQGAKATHPEDQKLLESMKVLRFEAFEAQYRKQYDRHCEECHKSREYKRRYFHNKFEFLIGFPKEEIALSIPATFEGELPELISCFAHSQLKITMDQLEHTIVTNGNETVKLEDRQRDSAALFEKFPLFGMMTNLNTLIRDLDFGKYEAYFDDFSYGRPRFPTISFNWESRLLGMEKTIFDLGMKFYWEDAQIREIADTLNGDDKIALDGYGSVKEYWIAYIEEEDRLFRQIEEFGLDFEECFDFTTNKIKREKTYELLCAKRRKLNH